MMQSAVAKYNIAALKKQPGEMPEYILNKEPVSVDFPLEKGKLYQVLVCW